MKWWMRAAFACWALPLIVGVSLVSLFRFIDSEFLIDAGLLTLWIGSWLVGIGVICLVVNAVLVHRAGADHGRRGILIFLLLLANFPAGVFCAAQGMQIDGSRYRVRVVNEMASPVNGCRLMGAGIEEELGEIAPGSSGATWFFVRESGKIRLVGDADGRLISSIVDEEARRYSGGTLRVTITPEGEVTSEGYSSSN